MRPRLRKSATAGELHQASASNSNQKTNPFIGTCIILTYDRSHSKSAVAHASGEQYKEGDILRESIISPADISVTDTERNRKKRRMSARKRFFRFSRSNRTAPKRPSRISLGVGNLQRHGDQLKFKFAGENSNVKRILRRDAKSKFTGRARAARMSATFLRLGVFSTKRTGRQFRALCARAPTSHLQRFRPAVFSGKHHFD